MSPTSSRISSSFWKNLTIFLTISIDFLINSKAPKILLKFFKQRKIYFLVLRNKKIYFYNLQRLMISQVSSLDKESLKTGSLTIEIWIASLRLRNFHFFLERKILWLWRHNLIYSKTPSLSTKKKNMIHGIFKMTEEFHAKTKIRFNRIAK
jgi:hypothetical protein